MSGGRLCVHWQSAQLPFSKQSPESLQLEASNYISQIKFLLDSANGTYTTLKSMGERIHSLPGDAINNVHTAVAPVSSCRRAWSR